MSYVGDFSLESTFDFKFNTRQFSTGAPFTLASGTLAAYPNNSTTEITAGLTLTTDFDSRTGMHNVRVVATAANGYAAATNYDVVLTVGTVDSISVVGVVVGQFSLESRSALRPTTAGRTLDVSSGGEAGLDWANVGSPTTTLALTGTTVADTQKVDVNTIKTQAVTAAGAVTVLASVGTAATSTAQTGDAFARLGTPAGASVSADVAAVKGDTAAILVDTGTTLDTNISAIKTKTDFLPSATAGAAGGVFIAGTNAATTVTTSFTTTFTGNLTGSVGSVIGAVGSVTGAVGSVTGAVGSVTAAVTIDAASVDAVWDEAIAGHAGAGSTGLALSNASAPTAAAVADAVWDELLSGHVVSGSSGEALAAAGTAGDPWTTALPGAYGAGTAGNIVGNNIDALISSRMATFTQPTGFLAATFPTTVASTTNITAGTITTTTNLTNLPAAAALEATSQSILTDTGTTLDAAIAALPTATENADALLNRDMSAVSDTTARSPLNALRFLRNKWSIAGTTLTVTKENDTTSAWTGTVTAAPGADPISGNDPA